MILSGLPDLFRSLYYEGFYSGIFFLSSVRKIARTVIEQHHKAKGQDQEQPEPKNAAQQRHSKR